MVQQQLNLKYIKGKQAICLAAIAVTVLGFVLDAITYHSIYSHVQILLQSGSILLCGVALVFFLVDRNRYYVFSFGLIAYGVIVNIMFTTLFIHTFISFSNFTQANILSRDILFIVLFIVLSGFILGRKHIIIQGAMLLSLVLYFILIQKESFFVENAAKTARSWQGMAQKMTFTLS